MSVVRRATISTLALAALAGGWLACSSSDRPASSGSSTGKDGGPRDAASSHDTGTATEASTEAGANDSGAGEAGHDASSDAIAPVDGGDAASGVEAGDAGIPPPPVAVCSQGTTWGTPVLLSVSTASADELDAITPDELTIAWTVGAGSGATIQYADRASSSAPFGTPQTLPAGSFVTDRAALSHDGLRLVVTNADRQGFSELTRTSRTSPGNTFGSLSPGSYANLDAAGALGAGQSYGDPVLSADDNAFYYSVYGAGLTGTLFRTARLLPGDSWPVGAPLAASPGLAAQGALRRQPTAISSDEQTLFFWDQVLGTERVAWINESTGVFDVFGDLGTRAMAAPSSSCNILYFSAEGTSSVDLFAATH